MNLYETVWSNGIKESTFVLNVKSPRTNDDCILEQLCAEKLSEPYGVWDLGEMTYEAW